MSRFQELTRVLAEQDLTLLAGSPFIFHCHHFNLFHDQTVEDALGDHEGYLLRARAAQEVLQPVLHALAGEAGANTPTERLQLAQELFSWMGQGTLQLLADSTGGKARGECLHYSLAWREKYGSRVSRQQPIDAFAAGFAAAATEVAFDLEPGSLQSTEAACFACREPACDFDIKRPGVALHPVPASGFDNHLGTLIEGQEEARITSMAAQLKDFVAGVGSDDRGIIQGFGLFLTRQFVGYYDLTVYETLHKIEKERPAMLEVAEALFGESGHVCVFNTFGRILQSAEWQGLFGPVPNDPTEVVLGCTAIARSLGFGHWTIHELVPGERLILRACSNYEAPFYLQRYGRSERARSYFFANAAVAFMQLAHQVDWSQPPELNEEFYGSLFKSNLKWTFEQTQCLTCGDPLCEVVVRRKTD